MRVLVGCEESQAVCIAFRNAGHEAYSCDLKPCSGGHPEWHLQGDLFEVASNQHWDLAILHPPCTYLTVTANKWLKDQPPLKSGALVGEARREARREAIEFFMKCTNLPIERIAIENPVGCISSVWRKSDQIIHPFMFGDPHQKATCLWLKNLKPLKHTNVVTPEPRYFWVDNKTGKKKSQPTWYAKASQKDGKRGEIRSKTFPGIAKAMAEQWSDIAPVQKLTLF